MIWNFEHLLFKKNILITFQKEKLSKTFLFMTTVESAIFTEAKNRYLSSLSNMHFVFQMTKCCEYFDWIVILKSYTCNDLYKYITHFLQTQKPFKIFAKDSYGNKLEIVDSALDLKTLLLTNGTFFKPIYGLPHPVVYKLYIDDGHLCHA
jgi:hypothetical protein